MRTNGLISAVMPTYNRKDYIEPRIHELLNQTYTNWELIIVDDGSTDGTYEYVKDSFNDERISIIKLEENSGSVSIPRAVGLFKSKGEFIAHIDDDVENYFDKFEILINGIGDASLVYGDRLTTYPNGWTQKDAKPDWNPLEPNGWGVDGGQFIYKAEVYNWIPIKFPKRGCDYEIAKAIKSIGKFNYIPTVISHYIFHGKNRSLDESTKTKEIFPKKYEEHFKNEENWIVEYGN